MDMTAAISELPAGGQVLVGPTSLARISTRLLVRARPKLLGSYLKQGA